MKERANLTNSHHVLRGWNMEEGNGRNSDEMNMKLESGKYTSHNNGKSDLVPQQFR